MNKQKFNRGDLVRFKSDDVLDILGQLGVILYTYNQKFGDATEPDNRYGVIMLETGQEWAWASDNQMDLVGQCKDGKYIEQARKNRYKEFKHEMVSPEIDKNNGITTRVKGSKKWDIFVNKNWNVFSCIEDGVCVSYRVYDSKEDAEKQIGNLMIMPEPTR